MSPIAPNPVGSESLGAEPVGLFLLGFGQIGRAVAGILTRRAPALRCSHGVDLRLCAAADSSGALLASSGFDTDAIDRLIAAKSSGAPLSSHGTARATDTALESLSSDPSAPRRMVLVDTTDACTAELFVRAMGLGYDVATANKKPEADHAKHADAIASAAAEHGRAFRAESTVGAGLPVLSTLESLLETGDRIERIEGALSGTLGFLMTAIEQGARFSDAVDRAVSLGYTEPDPVADLSGADVGRKAVILGRRSGLVPAGGPLQLEGLVDPEALSGVTVNALLQRVRDSYDAPLAARAKAAAAAGCALRYAATVDADGLRVGLTEAPLDSPLGSLRGPDNLIVMTTHRYNEHPLVVRGPGAGAAVTAAGVFGDIVRIASHRGFPARTEAAL